ncbi:YhfT family protein [Nocardioides aquiterrae]|uniref:YhfT family protein n=1 Tax=Nocardioides aquiterrae TaxID=203799 RepID=A0ABN1UB82_9ACTN
MLGSDVNLPIPLLPAVPLFAAMGALSTVLVNRNVSVFHDGLRPIMPSLRSGEMSRREVAKISFALALAFIWAFGLPYSVGFVIPLIYLIYIATDWIGVSLPADLERRWWQGGTNRAGILGSILLGGAWGAGLALALHFLARGMDSLPVPLAEGTRLFTEPVVQAFFLFPVLTICYHYGLKAGMWAFGLSTVVWFVATELELTRPSVWAFGAALLLMLVFLVREARASGSANDQVPAGWLEEPSAAGDAPAWATEDEDDDAEDESAMFARNVRRIKRNLPLIVVLAGLSGAAYNAGVVAMDPFSAHLYAVHLVVPAALVMLMWAFAFLPMKFTTAVVTGTMATGTFLEPVVALPMPNPYVAAAAVAVLRIVEVYCLLLVIGWIERWPNIREVADVMRTAIFQVMEIGFLVGGALAAAAWAGQWGVAAVVAAWFFNIKAKAPVMPMSLGAIAALGVGVVVNVFAAIGLNL